MRKSGIVLCLTLLFSGLCPFDSATSETVQKISSEHFVLDVYDTFNQTYLEGLLNLLEAAWNESKEIFGFATENVITVELHKPEYGIYGYGGRKPNTIELYVMDFSMNGSIFVALHEYGHMVFPIVYFDNVLSEGLANFFFVVIGSEITKDYGLEIWPGGLNITKLAEKYLEKISSWTLGTIDAAVFLLLELYNASDWLVFGQAFTDCKNEFSRKIEFALMCDFVRHMETLTSTDYTGLLIKYGFDLTNPLGRYVHGLKITSHVINFTISIDRSNASIFYHVKYEINDLSIQNLTSLSLYNTPIQFEPDTIKDEEGPIPFNYTRYGEWYAAKLIIYLRHPIDIGQNFTITISKFITAPYVPEETSIIAYPPYLFANCSYLSLALFLPENCIITETHPQPTIQTPRKVVWIHTDVVAFTSIDHLLYFKFREPTPKYTYTIVGIVSVIIATSIVLVMRRRFKRKTQILNNKLLSSQRKARSPIDRSKV